MFLALLSLKAVVSSVLGVLTVWFGFGHISNQTDLVDFV